MTLSLPLNLPSPADHVWSVAQLSNAVKQLIDGQPLSPVTKPKNSDDNKSQQVIRPDQGSPVRVPGLTEGHGPAPAWQLAKDLLGAACRRRAGDLGHGAGGPVVLQGG